MSNSTLIFVLIALGFIGIILSFSVQDKLKSLISLVLAGLIILVGLIQLGGNTVQKWKYNQRIRQIQRERQEIDFDALRQRLREPGAMPAVPKGTPKKP